MLPAARSCCMTLRSRCRLRAALTGIVVSLTALALPARTSAGPRSTPSPAELFSHAAWAGAPIGDLNSRVLDLALDAVAAAIERGRTQVPSTLTVIDYSRPSTEKRL